MLVNGMGWASVQPIPSSQAGTGHRHPSTEDRVQRVEGRFQQLCSLRLFSPSSSCPFGLRAGHFALLKPGQPFDKPSLSHPVDTCCLFTVGTLSYVGAALVRERRELSAGVTARTLAPLRPPHSARGHCPAEA